MIGDGFMSRFRLAARMRILPGNFRGALIFLVAGMFFTLMTALIKLLGQNLHVTQIICIRQAIIAAIVFPGLLQEGPRILLAKRPGLQSLRVVLTLTATVFGFTAVVHLPLAEVTTIGFAKGFFVSIFAALILGEAVGWRRLIAVALGFCGVVVVMQPGAQGFSIYALFALVGAGCTGMVMIILRLLAKSEKTATIVLWHALGIGAGTAIPAWWFWKWPSLAEWSLLLLLGFTGYAAQMGNILSHKWGEASVLAAMDYVRIIYAAILGYFLFAHIPSARTWIGAAIVIAAAIYAIWREARRKQILIRSPEGKYQYP